MAGSTRIMAFAAIATRGVDYETTVPIIPPPWAEARAQQPSLLSPKAVHCIAAQCNRVVKADPPPKCFACDDRPLCAVHVVNCAQNVGGIRGRMCLLWTTRELGRMHLLRRMPRQ